MNRPTCETCPFWEAWGKEHLGDCHRNAPRPVLFQVDEDRFHDSGLQTWPTTQGYTWCGEHPMAPAYLKSLQGGGEAVGKK